MPAYSSRYSI